MKMLEEPHDKSPSDSQSLDSYKDSGNHYENRNKNTCAGAPTLSGKVTDEDPKLTDSHLALEMASR